MFDKFDIKIYLCKKHSLFWDPRGLVSHLWKVCPADPQSSLDLLSCDKGGSLPFTSDLCGIFLVLTIFAQNHEKHK